MKTNEGPAMKVVMVEHVDLSRNSAPRTHLTGLLHGFENESVDVVAILPVPSGDVPFRPRRAEWVRCGSSAVGRVLIWEFLSHLRLFALLASSSSQYSAVYERYQIVSLFGPVVSRLFGVPYVAEFNGLTGQELLANGHPRWLARVADWVDRFQFSHCDVAICPTECIRDQLVSSVRRQPKLALVVPNAVDDSLFYPRSKSEARRSLHWDESRFIVGFVGAVTPWQGLEPLVDAVHELAGCVRNRLQVKIVGDGRYLPEIKKRVAERRIGDLFDFIGQVPFMNVPDYVSAFDIGFVNRTGLKGGATPIKLWEYMACGIPCLVGDVPGMAEEAERSNGGIVFKTKDDLALRIRQLVEGMYDLNAMGKNAHLYVKNGHTWQARARMILDGIRGIRQVSGRVEEG